MNLENYNTDNISDMFTVSAEPKNQQAPDPGKKPLFDPEIDPEAPDENPGINPTTNPERFDDEPDPFEEPEIGDDPDEEKKKLPRFRTPGITYMV